MTISKCTVSGPIFPEIGDEIAGAIIRFTAKDPVVGLFGGARVAQGGEATADGSGNVSIDLVPGNYNVEVSIPNISGSARVLVNLGTATVPAGETSITLEEAIDQSQGTITATILQQAIAAKEAAEAAQADAETAQTAAEAAAAGVNLPPIQAGDAGKILEVNPGETGYVLTDVASGGGVSSVAMTVPTGLEVSGSPITASGTFAITYGTGYEGFLSADKTKLDGIEANATADQSAAEIAAMEQDWRGQGTEALSAATTALQAASSSGIADGNKGDVTVSGSGATWTVNDGVITLAKMANLAQATIIGRADGAGTGVPTALSATQARAIFNVEDGAQVNTVDSVNGKTGAIKSLGQVVTTASSGSINLGNRNFSHIVQTGPVTRTITSAGREDGIEVTWVAVGGDVTLETEGAELIDAGSSYVIPAGSSARIICDGTDWDVIWSSIKADTALQPDTADVLTAGFGTTPHDAGTKSSGTYTPDEANGNIQYAVNGGAHTLAPMSNNGTVIIHYTNNGSAGAITTSGFTLVDGDSFTTTDTDEFLCFLTKANDVSYLTVKALP